MDQGFKQEVAPAPSAAACLRPAAAEPDVSVVDISAPDPTTPTGSDPATAARSVLQQYISPEMFEMWFSQTGRLAVAEGQLVVAASTAFEAKRLQQGFGTALRQTATRVLGSPAAWIVQIAPERLDSAQTSVSSANGRDDQNAGSPAACSNPAIPRSEQTRAVESPERQPQGQTQGTSEPDAVPATPRFRLADLCFAPESEMLQTAIQQVLRAPGRFSPLFVHGPTGSGKTHLAESIAAEFRRTVRNARAICISSEQFTNSFIECVRGSGLPLFRRKFRDLDLLVVDDVQFLGGKKATLGEFQYTIDHLARAGKQIVLTCDRSPQEVAETLGDFSSRMTAGLVCQIAWLDQHGREQVVQRMAQERGLTLEPEAVEWIASRIQGDARRLSGAVNRVAAATLLNGLRANRDQAARAISDLPDATGRFTSLVAIEKTVCECMGVSSQDIRSSRRSKRISSARMLAMWLSRRFTPNALSEIGDHFGGRSHSTVVAAQHRIDELMASGEKIEFTGQICSLQEAIHGLQRRLRVS